MLRRRSPAFLCGQNPTLERRARGQPQRKPRVPLWWDVSMDGKPDLIFAAIEGLERLEVDADGTLSLQPVAL